MVRAFLDLLISQQDYFWFLTVLALAIAGGLAFRSRGRAPSLGWLRWTLGITLVTAASELVRLAQPTRQDPAIPANLWIDLLHGFLLGLLAWVLSTPPTRRLLRIVLLAGFLGLAALRAPFPWSATLVLTGAALGALVRSARRAEAAGGPGLVLAAACLIACSPISPLTTLLGNLTTDSFNAMLVANAPPQGPLTPWTAGLRRWSGTGAWGVWSSLALLTCAVSIVWILVQRLPAAQERRDWRGFLRLGGCWLAAGLVLAFLLGRGAREEYVASQVDKVRLAARLLDANDLGAAFGPLYDPRPVLDPADRAFGRAVVSAGFQEAVKPVREQLAAIEAALPGTGYALLLVDRNGTSAVAAFSANQRFRSDLVTLRGPAGALDGSVHEAYFVPPYQEVYGVVVQARAPVHAADGAFLGWLALESPAETWVAGQAQARLQAFAIVGLGLALAFLGQAQRLKQRARDEALRTAEAARLADRTKTEFLARVSHELRTPIQSVLGYGELLQRSIHEPVARNRLDALRQQGELMLRLVNDLLDLNALQTGRFQLQPRPVEINRLVRSCVDGLRARAEEKGLGYHFDSLSPGSYWHLADSERIRQIVLNVVGNAIKFTDAGSVEVTWDLDDDGDWVLRVSDTGPGIPVTEASRLFQPFVRLPHTAAREGSGLGLALSAALCECMAGVLSLEPKREPGACFVARLRLAPAEAPATFAPRGAHSLAGQRILVVDDNTLIRALFSSYLTELGATCMVAADGEEALGAIQAGGFDSVVLDVALPTVSGHEVARRIRIQHGATIRIVGVSAHASPEDREVAIEAGMDDFLVKPVILGKLAATLAPAAFPETAAPPRMEGTRATLEHLFRSEAAQHAVTLAAAIAAHDWNALRAGAHYLKNSADVLDLTTLAAACRDLEEAAERGLLEPARRAADACLRHLRTFES